MPPGPSNVLRVALFSGGDPIAWLVRWQTRSPYSHAAFLLPCGQRVIESYPGSGVRIRHLTRGDWRHITVFEVEGLTLDLSRQALAFCERLRGAPYDWRSVLRFVTRTPASENGRWFCSELVFAALSHVGIHVLARVEPHNVSPGMLGLSHQLTLSHHASRCC